MVSLLLIALSSICNAIMDVTSHHFHDSIFSCIENKKVRRWFRSYDSWKLKYEWYDNQIIGRKEWKGIRIPVQVTDAWHFFKMLMIVFICLAISLYKPIISPAYDWIIYGLVWNLTFSFHYNHTFKI